MALHEAFSSLRAVRDRGLPWLALILVGWMLFGCVQAPTEVGDTKAHTELSELLEPPGHAPGEPHAFSECPDGVCPREQPAYLFSGEFHETVVDLRISSCTVGLDLVWARRYRSRLELPSDQSPLGRGWDHSYNIYLDVPAGDPNSPLTIHDGNFRPQVFRRDASGSWTAPRYHRSGEYDDDGRFVLTFADGGRWIFKSVGESARADVRRLWRIVDRHGNIVELEYDDDDRLERVVNAVGQTLELEYDAHDHIAAVVAQLDAATERRVTYEYYDAQELASVTLPAIVDTVTDNDFVDGTTTVYTYGEGNLLTIEDALGHVYLRNTYAFDRVIRQAWGDAGDILSMTYASVTPGPDNGFAIHKAWLNDRTGRVSEHFFDVHNQRVRVRQYTGFADPDLPTDDVHNRPTGKLRADDPTYFETRYAYNSDGHVTRVTHPRGNATFSVYEGDLDPQAPARIRGNLRERRHEKLDCDSLVPDQDGSTQTMSPIEEHYEYAAGRGNEHGEMNFVTLATDALGNVTRAIYDDEGNRTAIVHPVPDTREDMEYSDVGQLILHRHPQDQHGHRREIAYTHAEDGRRRETIVDPQGLALRTTREYDVACNEVRRVDPRGNDKLYVYNQHDQLIREWSAPARAYTDRIYDANMNVVRVDYQALACDGTPQADEVISTSFEYDVLNELITTRMDVAPGQSIATHYELDGNRDVTVVQQGDSKTTTIYDERGRIFRVIEGSAPSFTTQHDYDLNGNEVQLHVGLEGPTRTTLSTYDCADRLAVIVDPMGNQTTLTLDPGGNVVGQRMHGELVDLPGSANNILLERRVNVYDPMKRLVQTTRDHFAPIGGAGIEDGHSVTQFGYDGESRVILEQDDNGYVTIHDFDAAGRPTRTLDAVGNIIELEYDPNGNILERTLTDVRSSLGNPQVGVWTHAYDAHDNLIESTDPLGNTTHNCYDSLGNLAETIDPRGSHTRYAYDGAGRLLEATYEGDTITAQTWDASDRLTSRTDPNGNVTEYTYDALGRPTTETFADGTQNRFEYDIHGNLLVQEDADGTILSTTYDGLERPIEVDIDAGPGVNVDTTFESFAYDGRSLLVHAADDDSEVSRSHDSLGGLLSEVQTFAATSHEISYARDGVGNAKTTEYPSGRRLIRTFDGRGRTSQIDENDRTLVEFEYLGPNVLRKAYVDLDTQSDYAYDLARRMTRSEHIEVGGGAIDRREYTYDEAGNKQSENDLTAGSPAGLRTLQHDPLGRMVESDVSGSTATDRTVSYAFDDAGNRTTVSGDACSGTYTQAGSDALANQYSETPCEDWSRDGAGNLIESHATASAGRDRRFEYDHRGRLVRVWSDPDTQDEVALEFAYDALGRKIHATTSDSSERYVYDDWNVIEEYSDDDMNPSATYLYGDGLDERLQMVRDGVAWWYFEDERGSASAVGRRDGDDLVVERYAYADYGEPTFLTGATSGNPYLFAGARWLAEVGLYDMRTRHFDAGSGRFVSRDTLGIWGDEENLGNGYTYVGNMPDTHSDPTGEAKKPVIKDCHAGAREDIEDALHEAQRIGTLARDWFNHQADRKAGPRKQDWTKRKHDGRLWWGKYNSTRFNRIKWNFRKIVHRCQKDVITFKCRTTGNECGTGKASAWTHSVWGGVIRLCKNDKGGFFKSNGENAYEVDVGGGIVMHEVSHNINAIGDKKLNGIKQSKVSEVQNLAKKNPLRASWNAANYEWYAVRR